MPIQHNVNIIGTRTINNNREAKSIYSFVVKPLIRSEYSADLIMYRMNSSDKYVYTIDVTAFVWVGV